ncbi:serine hydrolase [Comamonas composti]|uniref:serine hydrolase n=1 Tax=Comamonas composti TaxID=408558 RepID=UPI00047B6BCA|nr:serine hydrolase [Comamonas composti]
MHSYRPPRLGRLAQLLSILALGWALGSPVVQAAPAKKLAKKPVAAAPAKKAAKPRVAVASKGKPAGRVAAKSAVRPNRAIARNAAAPVRAIAYAPRLSFGQMAGLHEVSDPLDLKSSVALVMDQDTHEVLFSKNEQAVLPIASLTKLMTGLIITQAHLPMDEMITITQADVDTAKGSSSRLAIGTTLSRAEMLHLALMSSENRAAHALGRTYPGGLDVFVQQMNVKARLLGMMDTRYEEPTGLSSRNQSSARDLAALVNVAYSDPLLREYSTSTGYEVAVGRRTLQYNNTNRLVHNPAWEIGLQKTGYISEAGRCLVMQTHVAGRKLIMVFLDSAGKLSRIGDAERVRNWVESMGHVATETLARNIKG